MNCKRPIESVAAFLSSQNVWFPENLTSASHRGLDKNILKFARYGWTRKSMN